MEPSGTRPPICYYGDDFTGSVDALWQYHRRGLTGMLFFANPSGGDWEGALELDVIGVAGVSRSLPTTEIEAEVRPVLERFAALGSPFVQYKMCSTFDSSPTRGSLGRAIELGRAIFGLRPIPVLAAQPEFGRYTLFGTHFARASGTVYRLDRHPTMARHPSTPMDEADLRVHLGRQTRLPIELLDVLALAAPPATARRAFEQIDARNPGAIVVDALEDEHLAVAGGLLWPAPGARTVFALGSGGLSYGIATYLERAGYTWRRATTTRVKPVDRVLAVSGSCAAQTGLQIRQALRNGWRGVPIDMARFLDPISREVEVRAARAQAFAALAGGVSAVVYSAAGPEDAEIAGARSVMAEHGLTTEEAARLLGTALGHLLQQAVEESGVRRLLVAGGDTAGYTLRAMNTYGLEIEAPLAPGVCVSRLCSRDPRLDRVQVVLKGGQMGDEDLLEAARLGTGAPPSL